MLEELTFKELTHQLVDKTHGARKNPASIESEIRLIACCLGDNILYDSLRNSIDLDHFYYAGTKFIWEAMGQILSEMDVTKRDENRRDINAFMLKNKLSTMGYWSRVELELPEYNIIENLDDIFDYDTEGEAKYYGRVIVECWRQRKVAEAADRASKMIAAGSSSEEVSRLFSDVLNLTAKIQSGDDEASPMVVANRIKNEIHNELYGEGVGQCVAMSQDILNAIFGMGIRFKETTVLAAKTNHGKTATAVSLIAEGAKIGAMSVMFFAEGNKREMMMRLFVQQFTSRDTKNNVHRMYPLLRSDWLENPRAVPVKLREEFAKQLDLALDWYGEHSGLYLKQSVNLVADEIERYIQMRRAMEPNRPMLVFVDYVQYCQVDDFNVRGPSENINKAAQMLSACAANYNCAMYVLAQHNDKLDDTIPYTCPRPEDVRQAKDVHKVPANFITIHRPFHGDARPLLSGLIIYDIGKFRSKGKLYYIIGKVDSVTGRVSWFDDDLGEYIDKIGLRYRQRLYSHDWKGFLNADDQN